MVYMSRTNIDLDDDLVAMVMDRYRIGTKREAVDLALRRLVGDVMTRDEALAMEGQGWAGDLDEIRPPVVIDEIWK
jgi:Arc/MetJ family transcription regulator